jgi:hypothetical protein
VRRPTESGAMTAVRARGIVPPYGARRRRIWHRRSMATAAERHRRRVSDFGVVVRFRCGATTNETGSVVIRASGVESDKQEARRRGR